MELPRPLAGTVLTMAALTLMALVLTAEANREAEDRTTRITARHLDS